MYKKTLALIVGLVCVAITLVSVISVRNKAFYDIPILNMVASYEVDEAKEEFEYLVENIENATDAEIEEFEDESGVSFEELEEIVEVPSIRNITRLAEVVGTNIEDGIFEIMLFINLIIIGYGILIMTFSLLATLVKSKVIAIIALIIALPFYIALVGSVGLLLFTVATVLHVILLVRGKKKPPVAPVM